MEETESHTSTDAESIDTHGLAELSIDAIIGHDAGDGVVGADETIIEEGGLGGDE